MPDEYSRTKARSRHNIDQSERVGCIFAARHPHGQTEGSIEPGKIGRDVIDHGVKRLLFGFKMCGQNVMDPGQRHQVRHQDEGEPVAGREVVLAIQFVYGRVCVTRLRS